MDPVEYVTDIVDGRDDGSRSPADTRPTGIDRLLQDKVASLAEILSGIDGKIAERYAISRNVGKLIAEHYFYIKTKLFEMNQWPLNGVKAIELRRSNLECTLDTLLNEQRREQVQCWQDVANLRREFWKWFKDYCDMAQRFRLVSSGRRFRDEEAENRHSIPKGL